MTPNLSKNWVAALLKVGSQVRAELQPLRSRLLNDPHYRMQSIEEVQMAAALGVRIDVNRATVDDWLRLPGLSIHQARSLVTLSQSGVPFHCLEDIAAALSLPPQRLKPIEAVLQFCYYDPDGLETVQRLNPNTASLDALLKLPKMDVFLARRIVQNRQFYGNYRNLVDLQRRLALPPDLVATLMHYFQF